MALRFRLIESARQKGDRFRDKRDWPQAVIAYEQHLRKRPNDAAIWVQLGHAEKEQGRLAKAEAHYRRAADMEPNDADVHLQLGHVLKLQNQSNAALKAYEHSHELQPGTDAAIELHRLKPATEMVTVISGERTIFFLVQDLFVFLHTHATMTGIQRVQFGIALHAMDDPTIDANFIINDSNAGARRGTFCRVDSESLRTIITYASGNRVDHARLKGMLTGAELASERVKPGRGSTVMLLGAFWGLGIMISQYVAAKRDGVRIGAYIYDIIPISHPEYCEKELVHAFSMAMAELSTIADFVLTISDHSGLELKNFLSRHNLPALPMKTVPLAHSFATQHNGAENWPAALRRIKDRRYVAYVSTIEGRKNHIYVVNAWRQLIADGVDVPDLVFVGRHGWRISALTDLLGSTHNLSGRVHIVHGLSDAEVSAVYRNAIFTVFTSFIEGWGLPVGESLAHHTPCVASGTSSIPEVGGEFVDYVDPYNLRDGCAVLRRMIEDEDYRSKRKKLIVDSFRPRKWREVAVDFVEKIKFFIGKENPSRPIQLKLPEGRFIRLADWMNSDINIDNYLSNPLRLLFSEYFYNIENFGAWMIGSYGQVEFATDCDPGDEIVVYLEICPAPGYDGRLFSIQVGDVEGSRAIPPNLHTMAPGRNLVRSKGHAGHDGSVMLAIELEGDVKPQSDHDFRAMGLGLCSIGFARAKNVTARADVLEEFTFRDVGPRLTPAS